MRNESKSQAQVDSAFIRTGRVLIIPAVIVNLLGSKNAAYRVSQLNPLVGISILSDKLGSAFLASLEVQKFPDTPHPKAP
ncbi:hypothetical protein [Paenibacillus polymyxa]|uniref:hypothetical protein n=1 Tax=Paenibacillus TaxID=44249 RepID=UPI001560FED7|nr:hypothetical protein [Paenibacillus polymyxa]